MACKDEILKKFSNFSKKEIDDMVTQLQKVKRLRRNGVAIKNPIGTEAEINAIEKELLNTAVKLAEAAKHNLLKKKLNAWKNIIAINDMVRRANESGRAFDGLEAVIVGSEGEKKGVFKARQTFEGEEC